MSINLFCPSKGETLRERCEAIVVETKAMNGAGSIRDLTPVVPMGVERLITAQMNYYANNGQNVRSRTLFHATPIGIGFGLTLLARVIRIVVRTLGMPLSISVAAFQQSRYGMMTKDNAKILQYNLIAEDIRRIGQEWVDLGSTLLSLPIGTINTLAPGAIKTEFLFNYYKNRTEANYTKNEQFKAARAAFFAVEKNKHETWKAAVKAN